MSLEHQGGPMSPDEVAEFDRGGHAGAACRLRRYDDAGKDPTAVVPPLESDRPLLQSLVHSSSSSGSRRPTAYDPRIAETIHVPARQGRAVRVGAGGRFRVIDPEGGQVADTWAFVADDPSEFHSAQHTRAYNSRLFPQVGEHFVTNTRRPMLLLEEDATPGIHDMLCAACDPERYQGLGFEGWHASCQENLQNALRAIGVEAPRFAPQPINLFMNTPAQADATIAWLPAPTKAGDSVTIRAELDLVLVVSACPQDIVPINDSSPGPIEIELL